MNLLLLAVWLSVADAPTADAWPGFRGDGASRTAARDLPLTWSARENVAWVQPLPGYGQSSPVVWKGRVYLTAVEGEQKEKCLVLALDAASGKPAWQKTFPASQPGKNNSFTSRAAPTPAADTAGVYVLFEGGDLIGLTHDGAVRWQRSLTEDYGPFKNNHGLGSSPAQTDRAVVVLVDHQGPSYLLAVDKATGKTLWKADRPSRASWTSPVVTRAAGRELVLVSSAGALTCYDAADGKELWSLDDLSGNTIPSATAVGDRVLVGAGENRMKPDPAAAARSNCCVRLTGKGDAPGYEVVWRSKKVVTGMASPVLHRGHAYFVTRAGLLACLDAETGQERFAERLEDASWATPVAAGDHLYVFGKGGATTVLKAGPQFEVVATNRLWGAKEPAPDKRPAGAAGASDKGGGAAGYGATGDIVYGVAAVDGAFFVRTGTELYCIRKGPATQK